MSTVTGNCIPLERLRQLVTDPTAANEQLVAVVLTMLDDDEEVRAWASDVLSAIESPQAAAAPQLAELTRHVNAPVAGWACKLLGKLGPQAKDHQAAVASALSSHPEVAVRQLAALALQSIPDLNQQTLEALQSAAASTDPRLSRLAKEALAAHESA
jgi:hypothetical protein